MPRRVRDTEYFFRLLDLVPRMLRGVKRCAAAPGPTSHGQFPVTHRRAGGETFGRIDDGVGIDAVVAIEVVDRAGLAEMFDPERFDPMAAHPAEPGERRRMSVDHGHEAAIARQGRKQLFDMRQVRDTATIPAQGPRGGPPGM